MKNRNKAYVGLIALLVITMIVFVPVRPTTAKFVFSSWVDDDGNGQGISQVYLYENLTGVWLAILDPAFVLPTDDTTIEINESENTALRLAPQYTLNHSLQNIPSTAAGINIMRCGIVVKVLGATVFSQENLTLVYGGIDTSTTYWYYAYITIPLLITAGVTYTVELTYEIYPYLYE